MKTNLNNFSGRAKKRFAAKSVAATLTALVFAISVFGFVYGLFGFGGYSAGKANAQTQTVMAQSGAEQTGSEQTGTTRETEQTDTEQATIEIESPSVIGGKSVDVKIDLKNSPGVASVICDVTFDESVLTLNSFAYGEEFAKNGETPPSLNSPLRLCWSDLINVSGNKTFATLNFTAIKVEADCVSAITLTYEKSNVINLDEEDVEFAVKNGELTIKRGLPGDINGDGEVNAKDLIRLRKYFSGWEVEVDEVALDVNGDGEINAKDLIRLRKYFAGWNVEIFYGVAPSVCAHSLNKVAAVAATCTAGGNDEYYVCEKCNKIFADETAKTELSAAPLIEAKGHAEQVLEAVAPTCTQTGLTAGKICSVCNTVLVEQEVIKATGHTEVIDEAVEPTCTNTGLTQGKHCSACGTVLVEQEVIPCHKYGAWSWKVEPAETAKGVIEHSCSVCGTTQTKEVPALYVLDKNGNQTTEVNSAYTYSRDGESCTASGRADLFGFTVDGSVLTIEKVVKTDHYIVVNNVAKYIKAGQLCVDADYDYKIEGFDDITCNATGVEGFFTCDECNKKVKIKVRSEHIAFDEKFQTEEDKAKSVAPACTAAGVKYYHCNNCGSEVCVTVPALGHDVVCTKVHEPADNNSNWVFDLMCRTCNETLESVVSEKAPAVNEVAATCTENAYVVYTDIVIGKNADGTDKILLDDDGKPVEICVEKAGTALGHHNGVLDRTVRDNEVFDMRDEINAQAFSFIGVRLSCAENGEENPSIGFYQCDRCATNRPVKLYMSHKGETKTDKYATCTESGEYTIIKCDDCKQENKPFEIPALGHEWIYTCHVEQGGVIVTRTCVRENKILNKTIIDDKEVILTTIEVCGKTETVECVKSYSVVAAPTCIGYGRARLTYADGSTEEVMLARSGHILNGKEMVLADVNNKVFYDYRLAGVELTVDESEITCDEDKLASLTSANAMFRCDVCNKARQIFVKKEHVYQNGSCIGCGLKYSENLSFTLNSDGKSYSVSKGSCTDTEINIPPVYNSLPVTNIEKFAFEGCGEIKRITIPDSIKNIWSGAFV